MTCIYECIACNTKSSVCPVKANEVCVLKGLCICECVTDKGAADIGANIANTNMIFLNYFYNCLAIV